jgi:hypothetical protein
MLERPPKPPAARPPQLKASRAARDRRYRQRKRAGELVVTITVDGWILSLLTEGQFLRPWDEADRNAVAAALQTALNIWSRYESP